MADALQRPDLKADLRFSTNQARERHWAELMTIIEQWTAQHTGLECETVMDTAGVPCSRFLSVAEAMKDPRLTERGSLSKVHDAAGEFLVPNAPFQFTTPTAAGPAVSELGADGAAVLSALLGISGEDIDKLRRDGVLSPKQ
jgi:crotonobetainyl-CoA:carnitine CoA-transferase CaiB-like acyl-CoA transferase